MDLRRSVGSGLLGSGAGILAAIASVVTLVVAGWRISLSVASGFVGAALIVLTCKRGASYLRRRWARHDGSRFQALRLEVARLSFDNEKLRADKEGLQAEVSGLRKEARELQIERTHYEEGLRNLVERSPRPLREWWSLTCFIGEADDGDLIREEHETAAVDDSKPILWYRVSAGADGEGVPAKLAFRQLEDIQASERYQGKDRKLNVLSIDRHGGKVWGLVNFDTEINAGSPRRWSIGYRWPGMFNPLRTLRRDHFWLNLDLAREGIEYEQVIVKFVFPATAVEPEAFVTGSAIPTQEGADDQGRTTICFTFHHPPPQDYRVELRVKGFRRRRRSDDSVTTSVIPRAQSGQ